MKTSTSRYITERIGTARRNGNEEAFQRELGLLKKLVPVMEKFNFSHIESKAKDQAKQVSRIIDAIDELADALLELKLIAKRNT